MKRISITDVVRYAALAAAMVISFAVERDLALSHGVPEAVAPPDDLWADFEDSAPVTPPSLADIRSAMSALESEHGRPVTGRMLSDHFGVSERTGRRYLAMTA